MNEQLTPRSELTPAQQKLIEAYLATTDDNEANRQHKMIIREYLLRNDFDPEDFRGKDMPPLSDQQAIEAIRQKYAILRTGLKGYQENLDENERHELAQFSRLDEKA